MRGQAGSRVAEGTSEDPDLSTPAAATLMKGKNSPRLFWFDCEQRWLATSFDDGTNGHWIVCTSNPFAIWEEMIFPVALKLLRR